MSVLIIGVIVLVLGVLAGGGLLAAYKGGYKRGYLHGKVDGYRKGHYEATGNWPETPPRRPGVIES